MTKLFHRCNKENSIDCELFILLVIMKKVIKRKKCEEMYLPRFEYYATLLLVREIGGHKKTH